MTQSELNDLWVATRAPTKVISMWEVKDVGDGRMIGYLKEDLYHRLDKRNRHDFPLFVLFEKGERYFKQWPQPEEQKPHWQEKIEELPQRGIFAPIHGDRALAYSLMTKFMELMGWHPYQPPACTDERCFEEELFQEYLKIAEKDFLKDMAAAFGYKITGLEKLEPPYKRS